MDPEDRIVRDHLELRVRLDRLSVLAAAPAEVLSRARWTAVLLGELHEMTELLTEHFAHEERGGYLDFVVAKQPRLSHQVDVLAAQHDEIRERLATLAVEFGEAGTLDVLRASLSALARAVDAHEHAETQLIQTALYDDIGPSD